MNVDVGVGLSLFIFLLFIIVLVCTIADIVTGNKETVAEDYGDYQIESITYNNNYTIDNTPISYDHNDENYLDQIDDALVIDDDDL